MNEIIAAAKSTSPIDQVQHWPVMGQIGLVLLLAAIGYGLESIDKDSMLAWVFFLASFLMAINIFFG